MGSDHSNTTTHKHKTVPTPIENKCDKLFLQGIVDLAEQIYRKHHQAVELILEHRPDLQYELGEAVKKLIDETEVLQLDHFSKNYIRFFPQSWDEIGALRQGKGWTRSNSLLLFEINIFADLLGLYLIIGPGNQAIRQVIFDASQSQSDLFRGKGKFKSLRIKWTTIAKWDFLIWNDYSDPEIEDLFEKVQKRWESFAKNDLPALVKAIEAIDFSELESD